MTTVRPFLCLAFLLLPVVYEADVSATDLSDFPPCDSAACSTVAKTAQWPIADTSQMQKINFQGFLLSVPKAAQATRSSIAFRQYKIDVKQRIALSMFNRDDMDAFFKASRYDMTDWADIVFTQTPKSKKPETDTEAYAWYSALMTKTVFIAGGSVVKYKRAALRVYWIHDKFTRADVLMIISKQQPNILLKMEISGFDKGDIMRFISGVSVSDK